MRIEVLGPVEAAVNGRTIPLGGQRQRALIAALALDHGKVVAVDRLVDVIWDSTPPATARIKVRAHVSALRRAIGCCSPGADWVLTRTPGYLLRRNGAELDLTEFGHLTAAGRTASRAGDMERAAEFFRSALALWRGPAFGDVASPPIRASAAAIDEQRILVIEGKANADLALGRCDVVVAELSAPLMAYPFRERMRSLVMLALYRLGCRADALRLYREGYQLMTAQLGLEPGPQLRSLQRRILSDDPALQVYGNPA